MDHIFASSFDQNISAIYVSHKSARLKRIMDILISAILLVVFLPLMVLIALLIKYDSPGNCLFTQGRGGQYGRNFTILKFRTMHRHLCDDGSVQAGANDPRITKVGLWLRRTHLDELPQLYNILRGDMALVGPRPHSEKMDKYYGGYIPFYHQRHAVKPGMTGWAQINDLCGETKLIQDMERRVLYDIEYIKRQSFWFDLFIILKTIRILFLTPFNS